MTLDLSIRLGCDQPCAAVFLARDGHSIEAAELAARRAGWAVSKTRYDRPRTYHCPRHRRRRPFARTWSRRPLPFDQYEPGTES